MSERPALVDALRLLIARARQVALRHPQAHLGAARDEIELRLSLPLGPGEGTLEERAAALDAELEAAVGELLEHSALFRPGRVHCLRCGSSECEHALPTSSREVFAGYGQTGVPLFVDFGQLLLDRGDLRVTTLFDEKTPHLLASVAEEGTLTRGLLPAFRDAERDLRVHGAVATGWYRVPDARGHRAPLALSFVVMSTRARGGRRRFGLSVVGRGPEGEELARVTERLDQAPWLGAARWAQGVLETLGRAKEGGRQEEALRRRLGGLLYGLARRLERGERARGRRTRHAEQRHEEGGRPTRMAVADLLAAGDDDLLYDTRRKTMVVLGERGRAHVFNEEGRLVTSVRYPPATIERRRHKGLWRPARAEEIAALKARFPHASGSQG